MLPPAGSVRDVEPQKLRDALKSAGAPLL